MTGRLLIAVITCAARRAQAEAQRATWVRRVDPDRAHVRFFLGSPVIHGDEIFLAVNDSYAGLPGKVKAAASWAFQRGYDAMLKVDDDVYLVHERLPRYAEDYVGNFRTRTGNYPLDYASGFCYFLSRYATGIIAQAALTDDPNEDRWVGNILGAVRGMQLRDEKRFVCTYPAGIDHAAKLWGSNVGRDGIAFAQYPAHKFLELETWYRREFVDNRS